MLFGGERLSYAELDSRANRLARYLRRRGVGPDTRVGLCLERSLAMTVALLGVLKAGAAYVPLDPAYPRERLALMIEDTGMPVLLTEARLAASLPELSRGPELLCLDLEASRIDAGEPRRPRLGGPRRRARLCRLHLGLDRPPEGGGGTAPGARQPCRGVCPVVRPGARRPGAPVHLDQLRHHLRGGLPDLDLGRRRGPQGAGALPLFRRVGGAARSSPGDRRQPADRLLARVGERAPPDGASAAGVVAPGDRRHRAGAPRAPRRVAGAPRRRGAFRQLLCLDRVHGHRPHPSLGARLFGTGAGRAPHPGREADRQLPGLCSRRGDGAGPHGGSRGRLHRRRQRLARLP